MKIDGILKKLVIFLVSLLIIICLGKVLAGLKSAVSTVVTVLTPFLLGLIVAYILDPVIDWMEKYRISRILAILLLISGMLLFITIIIFFIVPLVIRETARMIAVMPAYWDKLRFLLETRLLTHESLAAVKKNISLIKIKPYLPQAASVLTAVTGKLVTVGTGFFSLFVNLILFLLASFYFLKDFEGIKKYTISLLPWGYKTTWLPVLKDIDHHLKSFFRGQLIVCTVLATLNAVGLSAAGLNFAIVIGIAAGYLNIIPYFGVSVGIIVSLVMAYVQYTDIIHMVFVLMVFGLVQSLDGLFITPNILGDKTGLSPVAIIFSLLFFGSIFGFFGVLLAVPLACICKVLLVFFIRKYKTSAFYTS